MTLLDYVVTNLKDVEAGVRNDIKLSDHESISFKIKCGKKSKTSKQIKFVK